MSALSQFLGIQSIPSDFTTATLGSKVTVPNQEQGILICKAGGIAWVVAPVSAQIERTWYCIQDGVTAAKESTGSAGWFIPNISQLQNPGYTCRTYWSPCTTYYWSSTEINAANAYIVNFSNGIAINFINKSTTFCVRAFRQVTY